MFLLTLTFYTTNIKPGYDDLIFVEAYLLIKSFFSLSKKKKRNNMIMVNLIFS